MSLRRKIRIIHTSDTHLGDDWDPASARRALSAVVDGVHVLESDALLIAGDVFDNARVSDAVLEFFVSEIARAAVPTVILPGNHDLYDAGSLYLRSPFAGRPSNLHIITGTRGQTLSFPELTLDVWGRAMDSHTPAFRPLSGIPVHRNGHWLVAMAHGHFHYPDDTEERSSPIRPHEIAQAGCDYIALGHWERFEDVSQGEVTAFYSGSPMGAAGERGRVAVNVVDFDADRADLVNVAQVKRSLL
ncbi:MAG: metallophosphoesterase [Chloroflexota bacterium]|nr:metallophosphoesterase [Chloroflexota bacterium]MDE2961917.1 metallophosphoesterase [Chloroflexota bacterium]